MEWRLFRLTNLVIQFFPTSFWPGGKLALELTIWRSIFTLIECPHSSNSLIHSFTYSSWYLCSRVLPQGLHSRGPAARCFTATPFPSVAAFKSAQHRVWPVGWPFVHQIRMQWTPLCRYSYNRDEILFCVVKFSWREVTPITMPRRLAKRGGSLTGDRRYILDFTLSHNKMQYQLTIA